MNASTTLHSAARSGLQRLVMTLSLAMPMGRRTFANIGAAILVMSGFGAGFVSAAPITPTTVKATSYWFAVDGNHNNLINGSGLSGGGSVLTQTHDNVSNASTMWHGGPSDGGLGGPVGTPPQVSTQILEFDLGANYALTKTHVWNHNQLTATGRGVKDVNIWTSPDTTSAFTKLGDFVLNQAAGSPGLAAQVLTTAASNVRRVQFRISTVWSGASHDYVGLSEVRFEGSATPAPTVTSISPTSGSIAGGTSVIITGTDFIGATGVTIGGTNATSFTVDSATQITATTPAHALGAVSVLVTTPGGTNAANTLFTYTPPNTAPSFALPAGVNGPAGHTWTARESNRQWISIASSADGSKLAAVAYNSQIYTSTDSGVTWTARDSSRNWRSITSSADGSKLAAVVNGGQIYTSTDSGVTWTAQNSGTRDWNPITSSADGSKLAAVVNGGQIYTSTDSGVTWTARESNRAWFDIASSADGSKLAAVAVSGQIYTSTNSGETWTARESNRGWNCITSSADGTKLAAGDAGGQIYTSTDSGVTWTARESNRGWGSIISSEDGSKLAAAPYGGRIYTSTDSGVTWTARESNRNWHDIASSADGSKLAALDHNGQIYTSFGSTTPHNVSVAAGSGPQTTATFATAISPGPVAEAGQTVSFTVNNNNTALFTAQPAIASNGTLTFTPGSTTGVATVTVTAVDDGGTAGGGADTSAAQTFTITVTNDAPTDISLTPATIAENNAANATVGSLSATDANAGQTHTFTKVTGTGDTDNGSFTIDGSDLKLTPSADFETKASYSLRVLADDGEGGTFAKAFTVTITDVNEAPTDIALSASSIAENNAANASVGTLSASGDPDAGAVHTFSLVNGMGDADNAAFTIDGSALKLIPSANFEVKSSYSLRVEASDGLGGTFAKSLVISITDVNEAPSDLTLTPSSIAENNAANATVGTLASVDEDAGASALFSLVAGAGDTDNGSFSIDGTSLKLIPVADFEIKSSYSLRVQADDGNGGTFAKALTVTITDVNDAPTDITLTPATIAENNAANATVGALSATDEDAGQTHTFTKVTGTGDADNSSFTIVGSDLKLTPVADFETKSSYSLRLQADDGNGGTFEKAVTVTITNVNEAPTISDIASLSINEDAATSALAFTIGDVDAGTTFSVSGSSDNTTLVPNGNIVFGGSGTSRTVTVTPVANLSGSAVITVTVSDGTLSASDTFTLTVNEVNDVPSFALPGSSPAGAVWTARLADSDRNWKSITSSADGSKLAAVVEGGHLFTSTDSGATWVERMTDENRDWYSITSSADGSKLAAAVRYGHLYTSSDSGVTWVARMTDEVRAWRSIASSADGTKLAAVVEGGKIYTTTDSGVTWTARDSDRDWTSIASSSDGSKLVAGTSLDYIYTSVDSGETWTPRGIVHGWSSVTSSADGNVLAAVSNYYGASIYLSTDSGVTWTDSGTYWNYVQSVAISADGTKLLLGDSGGKIYLSSNGGLAWSAVEDSRNWSAFAMSADGNKLVAAAWNIYTSEGSDFAVSAAVGSGLSSTGGFATSISAGPANESAQTVSFTVNNDNNALFTAQPAIASDGTLTFTPGNTAGAATVTVVAVDDGGTANGGIDTSAAQTFTITVTNDAPTDISLTPATIAENNAANATVGSLSATDANAGQTHSFSLVSGSGDTDNGSFTTDGSDLKLTPSADFETKASYSLRVLADDGEGGTFAKALTVSITDVNEAPTDIALSSSSIAENNAANATVGTLSASGDPDTGASHIFSKVSGAGDTDNSSFTIDGSTLKLSPEADFETKSSYSVRVQADDGLGGTFAKAFTVSITDVSEPEIALEAPLGTPRLSGVTLDFGTLPATVGGALTETKTFTIRNTGVLPLNIASVSVVGGDAANFTVDDTGLASTVAANDSTSFTVTFTSDGPGPRQTTLAILNDDIDEGTYTLTLTGAGNSAPTAITLSPNSIAENNVVDATIGNLTATDVDAGQAHTFTLVSGTGSTDNGKFAIDGNALRFAAGSTTTNGLNFDGSNDHIVLGGFSAMTGYTIETWVKPSDTGNRTIITGGSGGWSHQLRISGGKFQHYLYDGAGPSITGSTTITPGQWYHVAITATNGGQMKLFVNGVEDATPAGISTLWTGLNAFNIGGDFGSGYANFFGTLDEVRIWNAARTSTQIQATMNTELVGIEAGLISYFQFNQGTAGGNNSGISTATATKGTNGTLQNFALNGATSNWVTGPTLGTFNGIADFETKSSYTVRVRATDAGGLSAEFPVTVNVTNVNEPPTGINTVVRPTGPVAYWKAEDNALDSTANANNGTAQNGASYGSGFVGQAFSFDGVDDFVQVPHSSTVSLSGSFSIEAWVYLPAAITSRQTIAMKGSHGRGNYDFRIEPSQQLALECDVPGGFGFGGSSTGIVPIGQWTHVAVTVAAGGELRFYINGTLSGASAPSPSSLGTNNSPLLIGKRVDGGHFTGLIDELALYNRALSATEISALNAYLTLAENAPVGTSAGTFVTGDPDVGETRTFELVSGAGATDNASFTIDGDTLRSAAVFDLETKSSYSVRVRVTDSGGVSLENQLTVRISNVNESVTDVALSANTIGENNAANATVGSLTATDTDLSGPHTFSLVSGDGSTDNAAFNISGTSLRINATADFETKSSYSVRVQASDGQFTFAKAFTITIIDGNDAPSDMALSPASIAENNATGATVGSLSSTDSNPGNTHIYSLVGGTGSTDNGAFSISGSDLVINVATNFETKSSYSLRVRSTDQGGLFYEQALTVAVTDVQEAPWDILTASGGGGGGGGASGVVIWDAPGTFNNDPTQVLNNGTRHAAVRFNNSGDLTVNGVTFDRHLGGGTFANSARITTTNPSVAGVGGTGGSGAYGALVSYGAFIQSQSFINISGLTPGQRYQVQVFTPYWNAPWPSVMSSTGGPTVTLSSGFNGSHPNIVTGSFVAGSTAQSIIWSLQSGYGGLAAISVRSVGASIPENNSPGDTVATLTAADDAGDTHTFSLVSGTGATDNGDFSLTSGGVLTIDVVANYEAKSSYTVRVRAEDQGGLSSEFPLTVHVGDVNEPPTDIDLSANVIAENNAANATVGTLSTVGDPDAGAAASTSYSLVSGDGSTDNAAFNISGNALRLSGSANFEAKSSYSVRVQANDGANTLAEAFTVTITDVNDAPTDIALSATSIAENNAENALVGTLTATEQDAGQTHEFSLVSGTGSTDNASFTIDGADLKLTPSANFEAKSSYSIRVRATDDGAPTGTYEEAFTISITDVQEAPHGIVAGVLAPVGTLYATGLTARMVQSTGAVQFLQGADAMLVDGQNIASSFTGPISYVDFADSNTPGRFSGVLPFPGQSSLSAIDNIALQVTGTIVVPSTGTYTFAVRSDDGSRIKIDGVTVFTDNTHHGETEFYTPVALTAGTHTIDFVFFEGDGGGQVELFVATGSHGSYNGSFSLLRVYPPAGIAENSAVNSTLSLNAQDVDAGATHTFLLVSGAGDDDNDSFDLTSAGLLSTNFVPDFETQSSYSIRVLVTDNAGLMYEQVVIIPIFDLNEGATDIALSTDLIAENNAANATVGTLSAVGDPDAGATHSFSLVSGTGDTHNSSFTIDGSALKLTPSANFEALSSYSIRVRATDNGSPVAHYEEQFTITVTDENEAPTDIALSPSSIAENSADNAEVGTLAATDVDAGATHTFELVSGTGSDDNASFTLSIAGELTLNTAANFEMKSSYSIRVLATDNGAPGLTYEEALTISITNVNEAPTALALTGSTVNENAAANTVVGTFSSTDVDAADTFTYTLVSGAGDTDNDSFAISSGTLSTTEPLDFEAGLTRSIRVRTTDAGGLSFEDELIITLADQNDAPTDIALSVMAIDENKDPNATVGALSATDQDPGDTHSFALVTGAGGDDNASFAVSGSDLILVPSANYEAKPSYSIRLRTTDSGTGGLTFDKVFTITINDVNDDPTDIALTAVSIAENMATGSTVGLISGSDADDGQAATLVFSLVPGVGADDNGSFAVDGNELNTTDEFDHETKASYSIRLRATDTEGASFEEAFTISITDVNEAPVITSNGGGATGTDSLAENTTAVTTVTADDVDLPAQTLTYSISGDDAALFSINGSSGELSFLAAPSYEDPGDLNNDNDYEVTVTVTDNGTGLLSDSQDLTITVTNANDAPVITSSGGGATGAETMVENTTEVVTVTAMDQDDPAQELTFSISGGDDMALFAINDITGELSFLAAPDYESPGDLDTDNVYEVVVTVTDDGAGNLTDSQALSITVTDGNDAPSAINLSTTMIPENSGEEAVVGEFSAEDEDNPTNGQTHEFALVAGAGSTDNDSFTIVNGELKTAENFDFETKASYSIRVQATDDGAPEASYEQVLVITVGDVGIAIADPDNRDLESGVSAAYVFTELQAIGTSSSARVFTISNPGTAPLTGIDVTISGTQSSSFVLDTSGTAETIDPGETTTFTVAFAPGYFGVREALIEVAHNGDEDNPFELGVTGTGATLVVTLAGGALTITDPVERGDYITVATSGSNLVLTASSGAFITNAGIGNGTNVVTVPLASVTNGIVVNIGRGAGTVTFGDMTGYSGPLTVTPILPDNSLTIRVTGPVQVGAHAINFTAKMVTISDHLQASGVGSINVSTLQGIVVNSAAAISVEDGDLSLLANQVLPAQDGTFNGIDVSDASTIGSTGTGQVTLNGKSGAVGGHGVEIDSGSVITGGISGVLTINGISNAPGASRYGLHVTGDGTTVTSLGANIILAGQGAGTTTLNHGVVIARGANVLAVGAANLAITGTGGVAGQGVRIRDDTEVTLVAVVDGDLTITGYEGTGASGKHGFHYTGGKNGRIESTGSGDLVFVADSVEMTGTGTSKGTIQTTGVGSLTFKPVTTTTSIGLGGGAGSLSLTDAALAYFGNGFTSITIGDTAAGSGNITVHTATFSDPVLLAGGTIYNAGGTDVTLTAGDTLTLKGTVAPGASPGKLTVSGKVALPNDKTVVMEIGGLIAGSQNDQIVASETVDIGSNVTLNLVQVGGYIPTGTETFTLIQRTGGTGTFAGMPEGHVFADLFGSGQPATLTYVAGTSGQDVALVMGAMIPDLKIEHPAGTEIVDSLTSVDLGKAAVTKRGLTKTFTVTNTGTGAVTGLDLSLTGTDAGDFSFSTLASTTLAEGASTTFTVTFRPTALGSRTAVLHLASNINGTKNPFEIALTGTGIATETSKPTLTITAPGTSAKVNEGAAVVTGTVKDGIGIALVEVKVGTGAWTEAAVELNAAGTTGTYSLALSPVAGLNTVTVRATDTSGNVGTLARSFTYVVVRPLTLATAGTGSGTVAFTSPSTANAASLQVASKYALRATAAAGSFFNGWSSPNGSITIASPLTTSLSFTMVEGAEVTANFIANPFTTNLTGSYSGLIKAAAGTTASKSNAGLFTANLLSTGAFTASVNLDGVVKPVSGKTFNPNTGDCTFSVVNGTTTWSLSLHLDLSGGTRRITGTLTQVTGGIPGDVSDIVADRAAFSTLATVPTANRGTYTVALPARASQSNPAVVYPSGDGIGTVTISSSGAVTFKGTLADGRAFTQTAALSADLTWPIFIGFTSRVGSLSGVAMLDATQTDSDVTASDLDWYLTAGASAYYPDGWNDGIKTDLTGALYAVPVGSAVLPGLGATNTASGNAELTFSGGNLVSDLTKNVNITTASVLSRAPTTDSTFIAALTKASGAFYGSFNHSSGGKAAYKGTILQKGANAGGYGHFLLAPAAAGNAGAVTLLPK